jgi:hypothetical protein
MKDLEKARIMHNNMVIEIFKENFESCIQSLKWEIEEYNASSGKDKTIIFILLNLNRIIEARGIEVFDNLNLDESQIKNAIKNKENYDINIINKMFEVLGIKENI